MRLSPGTLTNDRFLDWCCYQLDRSINYNQISKNAIMGLTILLTTMEVDFHDDNSGITERRP